MRVAVVGNGTGGAATALALARGGHDVEVLEAVERPGPIGAGLLLQPTGLAALGRLGLREAVEAQGARIDRLHGRTPGGRDVLDLRYAGLGPGLHGLGVHRGALFAVLRDALEGVPVTCGAVVTHVAPGREPVVSFESGERRAFDLVVLASGARSVLRQHLGIPGSVRVYPYGALWTIVEAESASTVLQQTYAGTRAMVGTLPVGVPRVVTGDPRPRVSLFWSLPVAAVPAWRASGLDAWRAHVLRVQPRVAPLLDQVERPEQVLFSPYRDVRLARWHAPGVALVGDVAHAMSPLMGQGVNLALLDAEALARALGDGVDRDGALAAYTAARRPHAQWYGAVSRLGTPFFQSDVPALGVLRDAFAGPAGRVAPLRRMMLESLAGIRTGPRSRLPLAVTSGAERHAE